VSSITRPASIRVLVAEDHTIVREGLKALLSQADGLEEVGEASDGLVAVAEARRLAPDVVVMDLSMPSLNGVDATRAIKEQRPETAIVVLSMHGSEEFVRPAVRAGARAYLVKGSGMSELIAAIRAVARGEALFSPQISKLMLDSPRLLDGHGPGELTSRERQVLQLVAEGRSSADIAGLLHLSIKTVENHRSRLMFKLSAHNVAGLVRHAVRMGLVPPEP